MIAINFYVVIAYTVRDMITLALDNFVNYTSTNEKGADGKLTRVALMCLAGDQQGVERKNNFQVCYDLKEVSAQCEFGLALCYHLGRGVFPSSERAFHHLVRACDRGDAEANCYLGFCYLYGDLVPKNAAIAENCFSIAAERGNAEAKWQLANLKMRGLEGINVFKGRELLTELIQMEDAVHTPRALNLLGRYHLMQGDTQAAMTHYLKAADAYQYPKAAFHAGIIYYAEKNYRNAMVYLDKAYRGGIAEANLFIGKLFLIVQLKTLAKSTFQKTLKIGSAGAYFEMGKLQNEDGIPYVIKALKMGYIPFGYYIDNVFFQIVEAETEVKRNRDVCNLAAKQNVPEAFINLGVYYYGEGNYRLSFAYFEKAAKLGHPYALERAGSLIMNDKPELGISYLTKAIEKGDKLSYDSLGEYWYGQGDFKQATSWYLESNTSFAHYRLAELNHDQSYQYALKAANTGHAAAMVLLGNRLLEGKIWPKNSSDAKLWYERAAELNNPLAIQELAIGYYFGRFGKKDLDLAVHYFTQVNWLATGHGLKANQEREKIIAQLTVQIEKLLNVVAAKKDHTIELLQHQQKFIAIIESEFVKYFIPLKNKLNKDEGIKSLENIKELVIGYSSNFSTFCNQTITLYEKHKIRLELEEERLRVIRSIARMEGEALNIIQNKLTTIILAEGEINDMKVRNIAILSGSSSFAELKIFEISIQEKLKAILSSLDSIKETVIEEVD